MELGDLYRSVEDKYYSLCEWLEAHGVPAVKWFVEPIESRGIPSLAVAAVIFLALIGGIAFLALSQQPSVAPFKVKVLAGEQPVEGALVQVYSDGVLVDSATTSGGTAAFTGLPRKKLEFRVVRAGKTVSSEFDVGRRASATIQLEETPTQTEFFAGVLVVDSVTSSPLGDARVLFSFADESSAVNTDAQGRARFQVPRGAEVSIRVTHPSYKQYLVTFIASGTDQLVKLEPKIRGPLLLSPQQEPGSIALMVAGSGGEPVDGEARLYDAFTSAKIASQPVEEGTAFFENVSSARAYVVVEAPGYLAYDGALEAFDVEEETEFSVTLEAATPENSGKTVVKTVDEQGAAVAAKIFLVSAETNAVLSEQDSGGGLELEVASDVEYYAVAVAEGRVPVRSAAFEAGETVSITLLLATDSNSGNLTVLAVARDGSAVPFASVAVRELDESFIVPDAQTNAVGAAEFPNLPLGRTYLMKAVYSDSAAGTLKVALNVVMDATKSVTIVLEALDGFLKIASVDTTTGTKVPANFTSYYVSPQETEVPYSTCVGEQCMLPVKSMADNKVAARARGYLDYWLTESVEPEQTKEETAYLVPSVLVKGATVKLLNVTDFYGKTASTLLPGKTYYARFLLASEPGMDSVGLYLRVGNSAGLEKEPAAITEDGYPAPDRLAKSTTYNPGPECADLNQNQAANASLKWVDLNWRKSGARVVEVKFRASPDARTGDEAALYYRAYAVKGGKWSRDPEDPEMGLERNSSTKAGCYALAYEKKIQVIAPATPETTEVPAGEFTPSASIWYDAEEGKIKAGVGEIALQVDTIFPYDAVPLNFSPTEMLAEQPASTATSSTAKCYVLEKSRDATYLAFRLNENNQECPIGVRGNKMESDESASISFHLAKDPAINLTLPIKLKATELPSIFVKPDELSEGDASAKLIYLINEKQTGREIQASAAHNVSKKIALDTGSKAIAWRGPGTLSFSEDGEPIWELDYNQVKSYFPGLGDLGIVLKKDCTDHLCCANGWCSKLAASEALAKFKEQAKQLAASTAFRRGNSTPSNYFFPDKQFSMSTVIQLREGNDLKDLDPAVAFSEESRGNCRAGNPGVYEITAASSNGTEWKYSARVLPLYKIDYVTDACATGTYYRAAASPQTGEYLPLCDFLFGEANCIRGVDHMVMPAEPEATDEHITPIPVPSFFIGILPLAATCKAAGTAYSTLFKAAPGKAAVVDASKKPSSTSCTQAWQKFIECMGTSAGKGELKQTGGCSGLLAPCGTALNGLVAAGTACDNTNTPAGFKHPASWDIPGVLPPRAAWLTCYAYGDGTCHLRCSKRTPYALVLPMNNQKWYVIHVGLTKDCKPNFLGISIILAAFDAVATDMLHNKLGQFANLVPLLGTTAVGLADVLGDPFAPGGADAEHEGIPPKGTEDAASDLSQKNLDKKLGDWFKSMF